MADSAPPQSAPARGLRRLVWPALGGLILVTLLLTMPQAADIPGERVRPILAPAVLDGASATRLARRVSAAHADVSAIWRHDLRWRHGRSYAPPELVTFSGRRFGPCAGARGFSGLAYCPADRTLSADLAFLETLLGQMAGAGDLSVALLVSRAAAVHLQAELAILGDADRLRPGLAPEAQAALDLDLALQADCLAGVWAWRAGRNLGPVPEGTWGELVAAVRDASAEAALVAGLGLAAPDAREEAFAQGYAAGDLRACMTPALAGILG